MPCPNTIAMISELPFSRPRRLPLLPLNLLLRSEQHLPPPSLPFSGLSAEDAHAPRTDE
jgi:hypothetical protein